MLLEYIENMPRADVGYVLPDFDDVDNIYECLDEEGKITVCYNY